MRIILIILFLLMTTICQAAVSYEVLDISVDNQGRIEVKTQYKLDGVEVQSRYPQLNGKYYWVTRFHAIQLLGMTNQEIIDYINDELSAFGENIIQIEFKKIEGNRIKNDISSSLINIKKDLTTARILRSSKNDGVFDQEWIIDQNGNKTIKIP